MTEGLDRAFLPQPATRNGAQRPPPPCSTSSSSNPKSPPNTGNIARLCLAADAHLHLVRPLGFSLEDKYLRRAGMDYWEQVRVTVWENWKAFHAAHLAPPGARYFLLTTKTDRPYDEERFAPGDFLIFGRETRGLPESLLAAAGREHLLTIPMAPAARSLNLATAAGIVLFEALRQVRAADKASSRTADVI